MRDRERRLRKDEGAPSVDCRRALGVRLERQHAARVDLKICYECGYDGFWLARFLKDRGIDVLVLDPSSFLVSRQGRRAKTDRIDVEAMALKLRAYLNGDESIFRTVAIPTPEAEDAKRISRERTRLVSVGRAT